jgi:hypothetical protein
MLCRKAMHRLVRSRGKAERIYSADLESLTQGQSLDLGEGNEAGAIMPFESEGKVLALVPVQDKPTRLIQLAGPLPKD